MAQMGQTEVQTEVLMEGMSNMPCSFTRGMFKVWIREVYVSTSTLRSRSIAGGYQ